MTTRRAFLGRWLRRGFWTATLSAGGSYTYARGIERHFPVVERLDIPLQGIGPAWEGLRVAQLSDLHVEPNEDQPLLQRTVEILRREQPDLIVITGDFITADARRCADLIAPLADLSAPLGVHASLGNHDVWYGAQLVANACHSHGISMLHNSAHSWTRSGETLWLAGLDAVWGGKPDANAALKHRPSEDPALILVHEPDYADILAASPYGHGLLQLSGHTHGGQVCLPGGIPLLLPSWGQKYARGLFHSGPLTLYVNRGLGTLGPKARFAAAPEITLITLRASS
ncbi:MAG: metallophosphoesterase [Verrucomicrobiales bacterium]|nr:metallophosphoesterase [Verrucomicrobiales bacterium]